MMKTIRSAGVVVAATIGAGIFALPYIFVQSGFSIGIFYLVVLGAIVIYSHFIYWRVLDSVGERQRLLGLAQTYLGFWGKVLGIAAIVAGLILTLVVYLILGEKFIRIFLPFFGGTSGLIFFWIFAALPLFLKERKVIVLETLGSFAVAAIVFFIFVHRGWSNFNAAPLNFENIFLPFGPILFSLAGWTSIEPIYTLYKKESIKPRWKLSLSIGTISAGVLYLMFVSGILVGASRVTPDTISGFIGSPGADKFVLAVLGIFAIWNSYKSVGLETKNALVHDLRWSSRFGLALVIFLPLVLVLSGFNSFSKIVGLAGGVFLSLQYLLILLVGRRALTLGRLQNFFLSLVTLVFILGAIYEIYYFLQ